jgi:lysophospholipase L1-like esterase
MKRNPFIRWSLPGLAFVFSTVAALAQNISWGGPIGITGDANLNTNGAYLDALILNTSAGSSLAADGVTFHIAASQNGGGFGDAIINYAGSGIINYSWAGDFPTGATASSAFAVVMDAGGIYQNGGSGAGTVTISGLNTGYEYLVQVFNYAPDGDQGLTTLSGATPVTLSNLPGAGGTNTYGEFATGTFVATNTSETFNWNGDGSGYTVVGAISVRRLSGSAQSISWGPATGITGDANLYSLGTYFDALIPNSSISSVAEVDGINFNPATSSGTNTVGDSRISCSGSGLQSFAWANSFPVGATASAAFASLMDDGGIFQNGGTGTGTINISGLSPGHSFLVQVFNYAPDGDPGLTTMAGAPPVTLSNLPGAAGVNTYGEYASGTFTASSTSESFDWNGAGSSYTVIGSISVRDVSAVAVIEPTNVAYLGDPVTLDVNAQPESTYYQWQTDNGSHGASWSNLLGANGTNYVLGTSNLAAGTYEFQVIVTNSALNVTSAPVTLTVLSPSAPVVLQNIAPVSTTVYVGQQTAFSAAFTGNHPIISQWQFKANGGSTFANITGQTDDVLTLTNLQLTNSGEYRLAAVNAFGSNNTSAATLTVNPWSDAQIQWGAPVSWLGQSAGQILTNTAGSYLEAADFFYDSFIAVTAGNQQYVFRPDGVSASILNSPYYGGQFEINAISGSGALGTNTTGDPNFDGALNQYYDGGISNVIILKNLIPGQQYSVQCFALDNRTNDTGEMVDFANAGDVNDVSSSFAMGNNASITGVFTATNTYQVIQENLPTAGMGNINSLVVRALSYTPAMAPTIVLQPRERVCLANGKAFLSVIADAAPAPACQWQAGPAGGPYTNLTEGGTYSGTKTAKLTIQDIYAQNPPEFVVLVSNSLSGSFSAPIDPTVPAVAQPLATARPIRITCVGASDVSSPTPYGTPNWPDYIAPMLGYEYTITNCGASGTTMIQGGNAPYWNTPQYTNGLNSSPDIVIIMLGSNDSKPYNWIYQTNYTPDYEQLVNEYRNLPSHPRIYLNTLLTVYGSGNYDITDPIVTGQLCPIIRQIAFDENVPIIDVNAATKNMPQNFPDNVHPDIAGAKVVAQTIFDGLMSNGETAPMTDIALNQPVTASSSINGNVASNAVDADYTTMWQSAASNSQWIYVDLGSTLKLNGVFLNWGQDFGLSYEIQVSTDALTWTSVYTNTAGAGGIDRIPIAASGRYVRMLGLQSGTGNGYDLNDFTVTAPASLPVLNIKQAASGNLNLSWEDSSATFTLESAANLEPPVGWAPVTNDIIITNGTNNLTVGSQENSLFFRLKQLP